MQRSMGLTGPYQGLSTAGLRNHRPTTFNICIIRIERYIPVIDDVFSSELSFKEFLLRFL